MDKSGRIPAFAEITTVKSNADVVLRAIINLIPCKVLHYAALGSYIGHRNERWWTQTDVSNFTSWLLTILGVNTRDSSTSNSQTRIYWHKQSSDTLLLSAARVNWTETKWLKSMSVLKRLPIHFQGLGTPVKHGHNTFTNGDNWVVDHLRSDQPELQKYSGDWQDRSNFMEVVLPITSGIIEHSMMLFLGGVLRHYLRIAQPFKDKVRIGWTMKTNNNSQSGSWLKL